MIRAVKVLGVDPQPGNEDGIPQLGFWDTITDRFHSFGGMYLFESVLDWETWARHPSVDPELAERCRRLIPKWVPAKNPDDD